MNLELNDIQSAALQPRPSPYVGTYVILRVDDKAAGREFIHRLLPALSPASEDTIAKKSAWISVMFTHRGLKALGVSEASLASFAPEFMQGMAARANVLGDRGASAPDRWEKPFGTSDVHIALSALGPDRASLDKRLNAGRAALKALSGVAEIWSLNCHVLPNEKEAFGFRDGISQPDIQGLLSHGANTNETPLKAGEFILGYENEINELAPMPEPEVLGKNGTYVVFRKLYQDVAGFRRFLASNAQDEAQQELLAAKMMGRWKSGAPLALSPTADDPTLGDNPNANNTFLFNDDDARD